MIAAAELTNVAFETALRRYLERTNASVVHERAEQPVIQGVHQTIVDASCDYVSNSTMLPVPSSSDVALTMELRRYAASMINEARTMEPDVAEILNRTFWDSIG